MAKDVPEEITLLERKPWASWLKQEKVNILIIRQLGQNPAKKTYGYNMTSSPMKLNIRIKTGSLWKGLTMAFEDRTKGTHIITKAETSYMCPNTCAGVRTGDCIWLVT